MFVCVCVLISLLSQQASMPTRVAPVRVVTATWPRTFSGRIDSCRQFEWGLMVRVSSAGWGAIALSLFRFVHSPDDLARAAINRSSAREFRHFPRGASFARSDLTRIVRNGAQTQERSIVSQFGPAGGY